MFGAGFMITEVFVLGTPAPILERCPPNCLKLAFSPNFFASARGDERQNIQ